jgi:hypothetical protein
MRFRCASLVTVGLLCSLGLPARADAEATLEDCAQTTSAEVGDGRSVAEPRSVEVVVPCAMVDSGVLGADCHDAAFYVVNQQGTLLCRIDVALLTTTAPASAIEQAPPTESTQPSSAPGPVVVVTVELPLLPQRVDSLPLAVGPVGLGAGIDVDSSRLRPS